MAVLVVVVALLMPMVAVVAVFSGTLELDVSALESQIMENMTDDQRRMLQGIEDTMLDIEAAMVDADFSGSVGAAQALYILALSDQAGQPGFVSRLVSCFAPEQTDAELVSNVNRTFGTDIAVEEFSNVMRKRAAIHPIILGNILYEKTAKCSPSLKSPPALGAHKFHNLPIAPARVVGDQQAHFIAIIEELGFHTVRAHLDAIFISLHIAIWLYEG